MITKEDLKAMKPLIGEEGEEIFYFDDSVEQPPGSYGLIMLQKIYRKIVAQESGTDVGVGLGIVGVNSIDSIEKVVGLKISINLEWEDRRIGWTLGGPQVGQQWEFSSQVLK